MDHLTFAQLLGNYGEFVGAIAVVATLGYLAVQVRQNSIQLAENSRTSELASLDMLVAAFSRQRHMMATKEASAFYEQGLDSYDDLDPAERRRFQAIIEEYLFPLVTLVERTRSKEGLATWFEGLDPITNGTIVPDLKRPGGLKYWEERKRIFPVDFVTVVDGFLEGTNSY